MRTIQVCPAWVGDRALRLVLCPAFTPNAPDADDDVELDLDDDVELDPDLDDEIDAELDPVLGIVSISTPISMTISISMSNSMGLSFPNS